MQGLTHSHALLQTFTVFLQQQPGHWYFRERGEIGGVRQGDMYWQRGLGDVQKLKPVSPLILPLIWASFRDIVRFYISGWSNDTFFFFLHFIMEYFKHIHKGDSNLSNPLAPRPLPRPRSIGDCVSSLPHLSSAYHTTPFEGNSGSLLCKYVNMYF